MLDKGKEEILIQMYLDIDDFLKAKQEYEQKNRIAPVISARYKPQMNLSKSEIMTILSFYHWSGYKCFQYYYKEMALKELIIYFPKMVSYNRFVELIPRVAQDMYLFGQFQSVNTIQTGIFFVDSKKLPVCENRRIPSNKVFKGVAARGKSSTGWFYGLKLHLVINNLGAINSFLITPANFSDNNKAVLDVLFDGLKGKCFGDKGYISAFFDYFYQNGLQIVTKVRKNMKNALVDMHDKIWLRKRAIIESVNDLLMTVLDIDHTRHRSPWNAIVHVIGAVIAYHYYPEKPRVFIPREITQCPN
jgi:hypothetical protein